MTPLSGTKPVLVVIMTSIRVDDCDVTLVGLVISCVKFKLEHKFLRKNYEQNRKFCVVKVETLVILN